MAQTLTEQLLLLFADAADLKRRLTRWSLIGAITGDPRLRLHRRRMERYLRNRRKRRQLYQAVYNLKRRGYLQEKVFGDSQGYVLSPRGRMKIFPLRVQRAPRPTGLPKGQWLMVFFDVPEEKRRARDQLRDGLRSLGFEPLQRSVWATRYRVGHELSELIALLELKAYVKPLLVQEFRKD